MVADDRAACVVMAVFCGGRIAEDMIWLSRLPMAVPSAAPHLMWYGPPLMSDEPRPVPQPRGPTLVARWPPKSSWTACAALVAGMLKFTVMVAKSSVPAFAALSCE